MEHRAGPLQANRSLSALIVATFVLSAFAGLFVMSNPAPIAAQTPIGDLIVTAGTYTVENVDQPVDGDILVSGGELIVRNASLLVISNVGVQRTVTVTAGGTMTLEHGTLTTYLDQIDPWPFLDVDIDGGTLVASAKSLFSFPGTITVQNGGELILYDSTIEALSAEDISLYISGSPTIATDTADDGPAISVIDGSIMMFDSEITSIPEYPVLGLVASNFTLSGESTLLAVNSYISVDFGPALSAYDLSTHNVMVISNTSHAYLYGCTFDEYSGAYASRAPAILSDGEDTTPASPLTKGVADNTGQSIASLAIVDGSTYEVAAQETLAIDTWGPSLLGAALEVSSITLVASYSVSPTYAGTNSIQWAPDGGSYSSTGIAPSVSSPSGTWYSELPVTSLQTVGDVLDTDIRFINNGAAGTGSIEFDRLWLMFTVGGDAYIYRWLNVTIGDEYGVPIPGATISATFTGSTELEGENALYFTANGIGEAPPLEILNYMDETSESYLVTKADGRATIPYLTDMITSGGSSNSVFVGSYGITGSTEIDTVTYSSTETFSFPAYPAMTSSDQQFDMTVDVQGISAESPDPSKWLVVPPDLLIENMSYYHAGDVIVASDGTLTLRNAVFELVQSIANERTVYVDGTANLVIEDSKVNSALAINIIVKGHGTLEVTGSTMNGVNIIAMDDALVILRDTAFEGKITTSWDSSARIVVVDSTLSVAPVLSGNALGEFTNSTVPSIVVKDDAIALIYRWIHVTVLDGGENELSGATVSAWFFVNNTYWSSAVSNESGIARINSLGTILTSEGSTFIGNYKINSTYLSDGVLHFSDQTISIGVMPYTAPLTENATFAVLRMSTVILPDLAINSGAISFEPMNVVYNTPCTIYATIENYGDAVAEDVLVEFLIGVERTTATLLNSTEISTITPSSQVTAHIAWTPSSVGTFTIWVVINGGLGGTPDFDELSFTNNQQSVLIRVMDYADLTLDTIEFMAGNPLDTATNVPGGQVVYVQSVLYNMGEAPVSNPVVSLTVNYGDSSEEIYYQTLYGILNENDQFSVEFAYSTPTVVNDTVFTFTMEANPLGAVMETDLTNNVETAAITVLDIREDFKVGVDDISVDDGSNAHEFGRLITITANIYNLGGTDPGSVSIKFNLTFGSLVYEIGIRETNIPWGMGMMTPVFMQYTINQTIGGTYSISVHVDYDNNYTNEKDETNNEAAIDFEIVDLVYHIAVTANADTGEYKAGDNALVTLYVYYGATAPDVGNEEAVSGLPGVSVNLVSPDGIVLVRADPISTSATGQASFTVVLLTSLETGQYTLVPVILGDEQPSFSLTISIDGEVSGRGIALWVWLVIIGVIVGSVLGVTAYIYFRGLGKLVECGECGAFIPAGNKRCPKCGVEFEVGTMKCSECGAWVPAESTECPNCGVKFVGEEIGEEDYLEKMRREYDEMVSKYRELAKPELGKKFSDKKFEEWWATQPTYISFDDWLAKEEEKRKEGPVPCPVCGTMNPKESTVCHKCGTVFGVETEVPPGRQPPTPPSSDEALPESSGVEPAPSGERTSEQPRPPQAAAPKMVIRRPIDRKVVPKKIIKTPIARDSGNEGNGSYTDEDQQ
ncbi:MAG: hypothetical protein KKE24_02650 [Candidatus Thermoplasmatota archaeon]|nr:hypothetical protein [Candidatus Thermoplasmatota archaeon]